MPFYREIFMNEPEDVRWVRSTHLRGKRLPPFASFTLAGNEDSPARLDLYTSRKPEYNERPVVVFVQDMETGNLVRKH